MGDFVVETKGQCFLCLDKILPINPPITVNTKSNCSELETVTTSTHHQPFQLVSRYLRMNMRKVFSDVKEESIPPELLAKVERSRLKVELCKECSCLNEGISKLLHQLEKIELAVISDLKLIKGKLLIAEETGRAQQFRDVGDDDSGFKGKCQIAEELRTETLKKSLLKLNPASPRVKLQKLTLNQLNKEKAFSTSFKLADSTIKSESCPLANDVGDNEYNSDGGGMDASFEPSPLSPRLSCAEVEVDSKQECAIRQAELGSQPKSRNGSEPTHKTLRIGKSTLDVNQQKKMKLTIDDYSVTIPAPTKLTGIAGSFRSTIVTKTGKHKCGSCSKEFASYGAVRNHYETEHLKARHKCTVCGEEFTQAIGYRLHYQNFHMHVKFKCTSCSKTFKHKHNLSKHQQSVHLGLGVRFKCNFCSKTFSSAGYRNVHMNTSH